MSYDNINLPKPDVFKDTRSGQNALIISNGHSTREILDKKNLIRKKFDVIIAVNRGFEHFDDIIDFHIVAEKTSKSSDNTVYENLSSGDYRTDVPRLINWKGIELYPEKYNRYKITRCNFKSQPDITNYTHNGEEGLLVGPLGRQNFSLGSVTLCAMHFCGILGIKSIHLIGADMCFKDNFDHFYNDTVYRNRPKYVKEKNAHKIVKVELHGKTYDTTDYFKESAHYIEKLVMTDFTKNNIDVFDCSDGLMQNIPQVKINNVLQDNLNG